MPWQISRRLWVVREPPVPGKPRLPFHQKQDSRMDQPHSREWVPLEKLPSAAPHGKEVLCRAFFGRGPPLWASPNASRRHRCLLIYGCSGDQEGVGFRSQGGGGSRGSPASPSALGLPSGEGATRVIKKDAARGAASYPDCRPALAGSCPSRLKSQTGIPERLRCALSETNGRGCRTS
jgi:hypothetical protein